MIELKTKEGNARCVRAEEEHDTPAMRWCMNTWNDIKRIIFGFD